MIEGYDVSHYQDPKLVDWHAMREKGVRFVVARAAYGGGYADRRFKEFADTIRGHGFVLGAYLFFRQVHSVDAHLEIFDRQVQSVGGLRDGDLFPVLDMEDNRANDGRIEPAPFSAKCRQIAEQWKARYGGVILYYSSYFPQPVPQLKTWINEGGYFHWLADYNLPPGRPRHPYTPNWHIHQPRPRAVPEYAHGKIKIDYDVVNPEKDFDDMIIGGNDEKNKVLGDPYVREIDVSTTLGQQRALNKLGYTRPTIAENGADSRKFVAAVGNFQGSNIDVHGEPLAVDGDPGPKTQAALLRELASKES